MSHQNPPDAARVSRIFFYILMFAILGWFTYMQFFGADERRLNVNSDSMIYTGTFTWEKSDGTSEEITVPGRYDLPVGETMVLTTRLPEDYHENTMAIRSSLQDVKFYINGTLRASYNTSETRLAGKNSASRYIFCETSEADAGKELRIELTTHTYNYSGVVNTVLCGDKTDIWLTILNQYGPATYIALFIFFTGLVTILFSLALGMIYHSSFDMEYLGWCMIMGGVWMMGESKLRQILVPNASALGSLCFVMILLCPIPILLYADSIQKQLHRRLYTILGGLALLDFAVCSILTFFGIADYIETLPIGQIILCSILIVVFIHLFIYMHGSRRKSDRLLLLGLLAAIICISIEAISVYFVTSISGLFIGIGMIILLFVNIIRTLRNLQDMELHRQKIEVEKSKQQTERISLQMMQTLATTIEAKDEYTRGHSYRVAEYAALIAKELGWSQDEITNLKHAAHLHDIGKIGIPDSVLNKPTQLTEDEDNLLKKHTIIGAEILKDVTLIPHVVEVTRNHHEHYDGSGYPDGLAGTEIPIYARIIAVADCYDAMNSRRIYRNALSQDEIYEEILKNKGTQFDPEIADIFLTLLTENQIPDLDDFSESSSISNLADDHRTISKFISDVVITIKAQEYAKNYDLLTTLPMRNLGERLTAELMQQSDGYLIFLDMDNLKKINDIHGHKAGDRALKLLGNLLSRYSDEGVACRLGGDEFLLFLPEATHDSVTTQMQELFDQFRLAISKDVEIRSATLSAGICMCTAGDNFENCYQKADKALYYVKQNGKNQFFFYQQIDRKELLTSSTGKDLQLVAKSLRESGTYIGAMDLNYRDFARQYEYMSQLSIRSQCHCYLVMVTMETAVDTIPNIEAIEQALECIEKAIRQKIRRVDICTRYSSMQYLIILFEPTETEIPHIMDRIFMQYHQQCNNTDFRPTYEYLAIAGNLMSDSIESIQLAPNGVVTDIYPADGNEAGKIDLIHDKDRGKISCYARDNHTIITQGPFELKQGSYGIAVRNPVYLKDKTEQEYFWGFTIVILRVPDIFSDSFLALSNFGYDYKILKTDAPWSDTYKVVYQSDGETNHPVSYTFTIGDEKWKFEITPKSGWRNKSLLIIILGLFLTISLLLSILTRVWLVAKELKNKYQIMAHTDSLTGINNRYGFDELAEKMISKNPQTHFVAALLDIDDFKFINDIYGHSYGDRALKSLADSMKAFFPSDALLGRNGGDEFCILLPNCTFAEADVQLQQFTKLSKTFSYQGKEHAFYISLGYAEYPTFASDRSQLMRCADAALYEIKLHGKNGCMAYREGLRSGVRKQLGFAFKDISEHLPGAFIIYRADKEDDELFYANDEFFHMAGYKDIDELFKFTKKSFRNLIREDEQQQIESSIWEQIDNGNENDYIHFHLRKADGSYLSVLDHGRIVESPQYGKVFYVLFMDWEDMHIRYSDSFL